MIKKFNKFVKESLTAEDMLYNSETRKILLDAFGEEDFKSIYIFLAETKNYKKDTYYHVNCNLGEAGVGQGLYLGRDKQALINFYDIEEQGFSVDTYVGKPKWLNLMDYDKYRKFEKDAIKKYGNLNHNNQIKLLTLEKGYSGIRYFDILCTGEEFVLFDISKLRKI